MKNKMLILAMVFIGLTQSMQAMAAHLTCSFPKDGEVTNGEWNALLVGAMGLDCKDENDKRYVGGVMGLGPGLGFDVPAISLFCPFQDLEDAKKFGIVKASLSVGVGANVGLAAGDGFCTLVGVNVGWMAEFTVGALFIGPYQLPTKEQFLNETPQDESTTPAANN